MPNDIDERVVQMKIENSQFVKGAEKTVSVLDKLKTALSFKDQTAELNDFQRASRHFDLSGITDAIETVSNRFTVLGIIGKRTLENIADSVYRVGSQMIKGFSIDQLSTGYAKYESKAKSVQTMMAASASKIGTDYANQEEQLADINKEMDRLVFFTDETSYKFDNLSQNIASFMSSGIALKNARIDLQGIAAAAGLAGVSAEKAAHASNNFAQAMSLGAMTLQDWTSLEISGIVTDEFKKVFAETAVEAKKIKKIGEDLYETLDGKKQFSSAGIREVLNTKVFDREVMEKVLHKYGEFSDVLNTVSDLTGMTATDLLSALDKYEKGELDFVELQNELAEIMYEDDIPSYEALAEAMRTLSDEQLDLGRRAFKASQEYNSFRDAIDATKEAVSTGWLTSFQYIFGDYLEAKELWTELGENLWDLFASGGERRNSILEAWHDDGGREALLDSFRNLFDGLMSIIEPIKGAFDDIFSLGKVKDAAKKVVTLTEKFRDFTAKLKLSEKASERLRLIFRTLFETVQKVGIRVFNGITAAFKEFNRIITPVKNALHNVFTNKYIASFSDTIDSLVERFFSFLSSLKLSNKALSGLGYILTKVFGVAKDGVKTVGEGFFSKLLSGIGKVITFLRNLLNLVLESFAGGFSKDNLLNGLSEMFYGIGDWAGKAWNKLVTFFTGVIGFINSVRDHLHAAGSIFSWVAGVFSKVFGFLKDLLGQVKESLASAFSDNNLGSDIIKLGTGLGILIKGLLQFRDIKWFFEAIHNIWLFLYDTLTEALWEIGKAFESIKFEIYARTFKQFAISLLILAAALWIIASIDVVALERALGAVAATLVLLVGSMLALIAIGDKVKGFTQTLFVKGTIFKKRSNDLMKLSVAVVAMATAVLLLAFAVKVLSKIKLDALIQSVLAIIVLFGTLIGFLFLLKTLGIKENIVGGFVALAIAVLILAAAVKILSSIELSALIQGGLALIAILLTLAVITVIMKKVVGKDIALIGLGLIGLAVAVLILVGALALLSLIPFDKAAKSLLIISVALIAIAVATKMMPATLPLIGVGLIAIAVAIALLAATLALLTLIDPIALVTSLGIIAIALMGLAVILNFFQTAIVGALALLAVGAALAIAAVGILVFAMAMKVLTTIPFDSLAANLAIVIAGLAGLAVILLAFQAAIVGALALLVVGAAMLIAAAGLFVMATALNMLVGLDLATIADGLGFLGTAFMILGLGGVALLVGIPGLIGGAAAIILLALAMMPFAGALKLFEDVSFDAVLKFLLAFGGVAATLAIATPILAPLGVALMAFGVACLAAGAAVWLVGEGLKNIADSITKVPAQAGAALKAIGSSILLMTTDIKEAAEVALPLIDEVCQAILIKITQNGMSMRDTLLTTINLAATATDSKKEDFYIIGGNIAVGIANGLIDRAPEVIETMHKLASNMALQFMTDFDIHSPSRIMEELASQIPEGAKNGLLNNESVAYDAMSDLGSQMLSAIYPSLEILSTLLNEEYDFSPTITPVVNMSDVMSSTDAIKDMMKAGSAQLRTSGGLGSLVDSAGEVSAQVNDALMASAIGGESVVINVYSQPGMNENDLANAVMYKIQNGIVRKGAALG